MSNTEKELLYEYRECDSERAIMLDYDEEPYGDDNLLVRAFKRRSLILVSRL
jgi:hypothetical protein